MFKVYKFYVKYITVQINKKKKHYTNTLSSTLSHQLFHKIIIKSGDQSIDNGCDH